MQASLRAKPSMTVPFPILQQNCLLSRRTVLLTLSTHPHLATCSIVPGHRRSGAPFLLVERCILALAVPHDGGVQRD